MEPHSRGGKASTVPGPTEKGDRKKRNVRWDAIAAIATVACFVVAFWLPELRSLLDLSPAQTHSMSGKVRERLVGVLRDALRDGELSEAERLGMKATARDLSVSDSALDDLVAQMEPRIREVSRRMDSGIENVRQGSYEAARSEFLAATLQDPGDPMAWTNLAEANRLLGLVRNAEEASEKALERAPDNWIVHWNHGLLLAQTKRRDLALDHVEKALLLAPRESRPMLLHNAETEPLLDELRRQGRLTEPPGREGAE